VRGGTRIKIKAIIFDFGFTLFYFDNPSVERYNECFKKGLLKSIETLKEKQVWSEHLSDESFIEKFFKKRNECFRESFKTKTEFSTSKIYHDVLESLDEVNLDDNTYEKLAEIYHSYEGKEWKPFPTTKETLDKLSKYEDLKLAVLSNHPNHKMVENSLKEYGLFSYFDVIVTSDEFGRRKPDPNIFLYTLDKLGLKNQTNSVIMCGDDYADIIGAQRANLQSVLVERKYKFPYERKLDVSNLRRIDNISEILNFIE